MLQTTPAALTQKRPVTYRTLATFWTVVACVGAAAFMTLTMLGPVGPAAPRAAKTAAPLAAQPPATSSTPAPQPTKPADLIPPPSPDLLEPTPAEYPDLAGTFLPKISDDKHRWPAMFYVAPYDAADRNPRIALVISGAGLDQDLTVHLLREIHVPFDVAFSAYMPPAYAAGLTKVARETGHECLLSIPMEPTGAPQNDEGPNQLVSATSDDQYQANLLYALSRLGGCVGATGAADNGMRGDRFAQDPYYTTMLVDITRRGLLYLDPLTHAPALYPPIGAPDLTEPGRIDLVRKADVVIDESVAYDEPLKEDDIRRNLATLEQHASLDTPAIGVAVNLNPRLIDILQDWARGLPARGITLVPLSATPKMPPPPPPVILNQDPNNAGK